ncbi:acyl-CoA dehydrogenase family protein [Actinophytocola xanthii]|uniref:Acyl-CoA dehydrogenase n=1 Tax=Actinophytocola xanthii TaxID=1912961 RepID=A0A1Q8CXA9_9PSEU|nr:acyl-CoA dehydrogenase family protein [Actinophytocola xanthii]OLF18982.1 acyl-CoA dehydrogenase [Actinophytocola xanthii]
MRLTDDQLALRDTVRRMLADARGELWEQLVGVGVPALSVPEEYGGLGAGLAEVHVVHRELGRALVAVPALSSVLASAALLATGDDAACRRLLPAVVAGETVALAWSGPDGRWDGCGTARRDGDGWCLDGEAAYVLDGATAATLLVVARTDDGPALFLVDPAVVRTTPTPAMDQTRGLASATFAGTPAEPLCPVDLARVRDVACVALAAELAGTAARCLELTVEYTGRRTQFGRPIGSFQALKHRMADMHVLVETAESAALAAALAEPSELPLLAAVAKAHCAEAASEVAGEMIQLHGGIAITWEHDAHRYLKRAHAGAHLFGAPATHVDRMARLAGF